MIETKPFSHDLIYDQAEDFFLSKGITKKSFRLKRPNLVYEQTLVNNLTLEEITAFGIDYGHSDWKDFIQYLNKKCHFKSKISSIIQRYDDFFNHEQEDECYKNYLYHLIDATGRLRQVNVFEFNELEMGDYHMSLFEVDDSDMEDFENKVRDYYLEYFGRPLPEELKKPFDTLTAEELQIIRMVCI